MTMTLTETGVDRYVVEFDHFLRDLPVAGPERIEKLRHTAFERFVDLGFPTVREEQWRFTNVAPIARTELRLDSAPAEISDRDLAPFDYEGCAQLVVVNGRFVPERSRLDGLPEGVVACGLAEALERYPDQIERHLARYARFEEQAFVALNTAFLRDGVFLYVPRNVVVEQPVNIVMVGRPEERPIGFFPRNLFVAEESSQVTVVEQYVTVGEGSYLCSPVTEVVTGDNAVIDHYKLQRETTEAFHTATFQIQLGRDSNFSSHSISWGGAIVRNDVKAVLDGEGAEATLNGLYMVEGTQLVDNHMRVDHVQPHCDSHELYKGILEGKARAVFSGLIHVHPGAQKTDAKQTNRNLLMSPDALCNSQPQLEIFADDVKCTHGSTVGQLDDTAVFYLRSRGIGEEAARSLLTYAFASDIVDRIKVGSVKRDLEEFLFRRLPKGDIVRQAV
ncbi:MAG: Fe-S cluster assembly protein SufD [Thermoanaerobaculia bacterium]